MAESKDLSDSGAPDEGKELERGRKESTLDRSEGRAEGFMVGFLAALFAGLPLALLTLNAAAEQLYTATVVVAVLIALLGFIGVCLFLFRKKIFSWAGIIRLSGVGDIYDPAADAMESILSGDQDEAVGHARIAARRYVVWKAWVRTRNWFLGGIVGLSVAFTGLAGTALIFEQNKLLATQNAASRAQALGAQIELEQVLYSQASALQTAKERLVELSTSLTGDPLENFVCLPLPRTGNFARPPGSPPVVQPDATPLPQQQCLDVRLSPSRESEVRLGEVTRFLAMRLNSSGFSTTRLEDYMEAARVCRIGELEAFSRVLGTPHAFNQSVNMFQSRMRSDPDTKRLKSTDQLFWQLDRLEIPLDDPTVRSVALGIERSLRILEESLNDAVERCEDQELLVARRIALVQSDIGAFAPSGEETTDHTR